MSTENEVDTLAASIGTPIVEALCSDPNAVITEPVLRAVAEVYVRSALKALRAAQYVEAVAKIHEAYRHLVMDTVEDRALHDRLVSTADDALNLARAALTELTQEPAADMTAEPEASASEVSASDEETVLS